jgi:hypothetical protein
MIRSLHPFRVAEASAARAVVDHLTFDYCCAGLLT